MSLPESAHFKWTVQPESENQRIDQFASDRMPNASRAEVQRLIRCGAVTVNGGLTRASYRLRSGDGVQAHRPPPIPSTVEPERIPLDVVFEDGELLVIDKARGMVTHPAPGSPAGTLVNAVLAHVEDLSGIGGETRPGIVHRLDKDTGGLLVVAKTDAAHRNLQKQIEAKTAHRRYKALIWGSPKFESAVVDAPIGRHPADRKKMAVITDTRSTSRRAQTEVTVLSRFAGVFALIEARLSTGRTHQIRVHSAYSGHPIVGDPLYGGVRAVPAHTFSTTRRAEIAAAISALNGQALHAYYLSFDHPMSGERLTFESRLPDVMESLITLLS